MDERRKKHGWGFWFVGTIMLPVLYIASFGPMCWLVDRGTIAARPLATMYRPILIATNRWRNARSIAEAYVNVGATDTEWTLARLEDALGLPAFKGWNWPIDMLHDLPHRRRDEQFDYYNTAHKR